MISRKLIIGAGSGLLGALALAGAVFAQEDSPNNQNPRNAINDRVAEILGIEREDLDSAMQVARKEHHEKKREEHLSALVEAGTITQEQADEIKAWQNNKPEAMNKLNKLIAQGERSNIAAHKVAEETGYQKKWLYSKLHKRLDK